MSDGNYHRNLLPYKDYQSGLRAGRAQMRSEAIRAFETWYADHNPDAPESKREEALRQYRELLP